MMYLGSKKRLAKKIWETIKNHVNITENICFVDLFCGGCGMISQVPLKNRIANDINTPLIAYLEKIVKDTEWMPRKSFLTKEKYNFIKRNKDKYKPFFLGYVGFNFSYGASYFQGIRKEQGYSHALSTYKTAVKDAKALKGVKFYNLDYKKVPIPPKSIVYCDIPYEDTVGYNGTEGAFNRKEFFEYAKKLQREGHYVFISEYNIDSSDVKEVGTYIRRDNMKNGAKSRTGKKFGKKERFKIKES